MSVGKKSVRLCQPLLVGALCLLLVCGALFGGIRYMLLPVDARENARVERLEIPAGTSVRTVAARLEQDGIVRSARFFYLAARYSFLTGRSHSFVLKSGVYDVDSSLSVKALLDLLESAQQAYIHAVFPEGSTVSKVAAILEESGVCAAENFRKAARSAALLAGYAIPANSFEGYLFPDTYFFTPGMDAELVVKMMADNFFAHVAEIPALADVSPEVLFKTLTLASIVEREYRLESEAPLIASVFTNRLASGMGLYSCATIEYIITELQNKPHPEVITYADLQIESPYNTYKWAGLTPGPISNPGMIALEAAANPPVTDYYYFRLTDAAVGAHTFSKSFSAHTDAGVVYRTKKAASR